MRKRALGRTGIEVPEIGFGGWAIGGNAHGNSLGPTDDATSRAAIERALELGVTFFDTADCYGFGHSERLLGEAFAISGCRGKLVIATKAGSDFTNPSDVRRRFDGAYLRDALRRSLERLRTDSVDIFQLHDPPADVIRAPETADALRRIKEEGLARAVGVSFHTLDEGLAALDAGVYETIQIAFSVAHQWVGNRLIARARASGVGVIGREPLAQGFLSGKYGLDQAFVPGDFRAGLPVHLKEWAIGTAAKMREYFHGRHKVEKSLAAIALQFVLAEPGVSVVIASMKTPEQVRQNMAVASLLPLTAKQLAWLHE